MTCAFVTLAPGALVLNPPCSVVEFAEDRHEIVVGSAQGLYSADAFPYQREPLDALSREDVRRVSLLWGSQLGKSTLEEVFLHYVVEQDPGPALWVLPDKISRDYLVDQRLDAAITGSETWKAQLAFMGQPVSHQRICFHAMVLNLAMASSSAQLAQKSIRWLMLDEIDKFPEKTRGEGSPLRQAEKRVQSYPDHKIVESSTPTSADGAICKSYDKSSKHEWHVPCPVCGTAAPWDWRRVDCHWKDYKGKYTYGEFAELLEMRQVPVDYVCESCGAAISEDAKDEMNRGGVWIAQRPEITWHLGFHLPSLASPFLTLRALAVEWFRAQHEKHEDNDDLGEQDFVQHRLAKPYQRKNLRFENADVIARVDTLTAAGVIPAGMDVVSTGIDVQADGCWWSTRAGKRDPLKVHTVEHGWHEGSVWDCEHLVFREFELAQRGSKHRAHVVLVDSGDGLQTAEVYRFCAAMSQKGIPCFPIKGAGGTERSSALAGGRLYQRSKADDADHAGRLILLDVNGIKDLDASLMEKGRVSYHEGIAEDEHFQRHMAAEIRVTENGKTYWKAIKRHNHLRDAECYALAGLLMLKLVRTGTKRGTGKRVVVHNTARRPQ